MVHAQEIPKIVPYVNDFAGVLSQEEISSINYLAQQIEKNTTVQIAVLTVKTTQPLDIDSYANRVFRENGIGHRDNNNGLLIVAAIDDREWRIEVGYGLEGVINDAKAGDIGRTYLVPNFQKGEYGLGLYSAVESIGRIVSGSGDPYLISKNPSDFIFNSYDILFSYLPFIIIFLLIFVPGIVSHFSRCPKCGAITYGGWQEGKMVFVCKNNHTWTKKRRIKRFFWFFGGFGGSGGGGGFGGGSSGGGGARGKW